MSTEIRASGLDPNSPTDWLLAEKLDNDSLEALNPEELNHELMNPDQLRRWMTNGKKHELVVFTREIDGETEVLGFENMDKQSDGDYTRRSKAIRLAGNIPSNRPVWEFNFWSEPNFQVMNIIITLGRELNDFGARHPRSSVAMFVDAKDMVKETGANSVTELDDLDRREQLELNYPDTQILTTLGFTGLRKRIPYETRTKDLVYLKHI